MLSTLQKVSDWAEKAHKLGILLSQILLIAMITGVMRYQNDQCGHEHMNILHLVVEAGIIG